MDIDDDTLLLDTDAYPWPPRWDALLVTARRSGDCLDLVVAGEIDATSARLPALELECHLGTGITEVRADLAGVTFADTALIPALVNCARLAGDRGARFVVVHPSRPVLLVLELTGTTDQLLGDEPAPST